MKNIIVIIGLCILLASCENPIKMETIVHEDGSLDKSITLEKLDSAYADRNVFGISKESGWDVTIEKSNGKDAQDKFDIRFTKSFASSVLANKELDTGRDTLFNIHTSFEKNFRWFYTYIRYSETFRPIDRLKKMKADDYFAVEDKSFINRMPGEGAVISKADSFYLEQLNEKIFKHYANWGLFQEQMDILKEVLKRNSMSDNWYDTLEKHKDTIFEALDDKRGDNAFAQDMAKKLDIPLPPTAEKDFKELSKDINSRIDFMSFARDGKYTNVFEMPWEVVSSNADSTAGNKLYWKPLSTKFAIQEYEMYAESRKLNWWAIGVSLVVIGLSVFSLFKRRN